ncbi:hypothetical protein QQX09_07740 [Demequina sp. SYSU T00192]|uniref:Uncharacterized protein n=1 Tax=Demequina litoralis TaxID=3051660 RepID=A0ABT8G9C9_9MICO|nr:hypothetical protein [Demequina sp. SYSU T00192]MDN4475745.1 hypothetical protein [Demequina sp. SYSU T00192]
MSTAERIMWWGAVGVAAGALAACDATEPGDAAAATPSASVATVTTGPADDAELSALLGSFEPEIAGFDVPSQFAGRGDVYAVEDWYAEESGVIEPAACAPFDDATRLATDQDLGAAGRDLRYAVGWYFPDGEMPEEPPFEPSIEVQVRVFGDEVLAAAVPAAVLGAHCEGFTSTATWDEGTNVLEHEVATVDEVTLPGLDEPTVRIVWAKGVATDYDLDGEVVGTDWRDGWTQYVHVDGVDAITVELPGVDDEEAVAAQVIADFLDHMAAG